MRFLGGGAQNRGPMGRSVEFPTKMPIWASQYPEANRAEGTPLGWTGIQKSGTRAPSPFPA